MKAARILKIGGIILVALALLGGGLAAYLSYKRVKPDVNKVGGTILVYEVDDATLPPDFQPEAMTAALERRLDALDVTVRRDGDNRFEIQIPRRQSDHDADVADTKTLVAQQGQLEFLIAANPNGRRGGVSTVPANI